MRDGLLGRREIDLSAVEEPREQFGCIARGNELGRIAGRYQPTPVEVVEYQLIMGSEAEIGTCPKAVHSARNRIA